MPAWKNVLCWSGLARPSWRCGPRAIGTRCGRGDRRGRQYRHGAQAQRARKKEEKVQAGMLTLDTAAAACCETSLDAKRDAEMDLPFVVRTTIRRNQVKPNEEL